MGKDDDGRHAKDSRYGEGDRTKARQQQNDQSKKDIGPEFGADAPTRRVPRQPISDVNGLQQQNLYRQRGKRCRACCIEGGCRRRHSQSRSQAILEDRNGDERGKHCDMQRPDAAESAHDELPDFKRRLQLIAVGVGDDKAAQDEEKINEEVAVTNEAQGIDMVGRFEMKQHDA